jgi:hypothetical protein
MTDSPVHIKAVSMKIDKSKPILTHHHALFAQGSGRRAGFPRHTGAPLRSSDQEAPA